MPQNFSISGERKRKKISNSFAALLSCCLFWFVVSACLLTALVLIGKHNSRNFGTESLDDDEPIEVQQQFLKRLPEDARPVHYDLTLKPDLDSGNFQGFVNVTVNVTRIRKELILHSKHLTIDTVQLSRTNDSKVFHNVNVQDNVADEVIIILPKEPITPGTYNVHIKFAGSLIDKLVGFYRSRVHVNGSNTRYMATSKFEPTYARQAFPCFDEPNMKATYTIHLLKPTDSEYIALSNNPQTSEEIVPEGTMVHFEKTVPMSTYLTCFIVSDFVSTNTSFVNGDEETPFKVYATPEQLDKTTYAGEVGKRVIEYYIKYFNISYPLPKLDLVAIPDFVSGAMEHWGLVTFRETALLYTSKTHSSSNKQRVATVVAHELAHSWFGNLVTMDWWSDLWLNEGFASYIEYKGTNAAEPDWGMMEQFLVEDLHPVLTLDAKQSSHPIIRNVLTPDQITEVFDTISYNKGAAILRMLESVVGLENFRKGVTNYLNKYHYSNAITQYLWDELQAVFGDSVNITEFMNTFTRQMGYPIIELKIEDSQYIFTQKRFLEDPDSATSVNDSPYNYKWSIPVSYITDKGTSNIFWFNYDMDKLAVDKPTDVKFVKFNPSQVGYYRVNYLEEDWQNLIKLMNDGVFSVSDRTHLLEETFSIAKSGDLNYTVPLDLTKYLEKEFDYTPWNVACSAFINLGERLSNSQYESAFKEYVVKLLKPAYNKLTWTENIEDKHLERLTRTIVLSLACRMENAEALNEAKKRFDDWLSNGGELSQDLRGIIYKYGMISADEETWNKLFEIFVGETDANEKLKLMNGLSAVQKPHLLTKLIELAKNERYVRSQDYFTLLSYISANPVGKPIVWDYVREHWTELVARFTLNSRLLGRLIPIVTGSFATQTKLDELTQFFEKYPEAGAGADARKQAHENIVTNMKWAKKYLKTVEDWIKTNAQ